MKTQKKRTSKQIFLLILTFCIFLFPIGRIDVSAAVSTAPDVNCRSAVLMEASTGKILYEKNANEALPPASVTKVMTLILVMEALQNGSIHLSDIVTASAHACSMGGSQIYLKEGEQMSVEDLLKSVVIASANDAAVALAEYIAGTEEAFVSHMNEKAKTLGLNHTNFENTNGLDDTSVNHVTSAHDIAVMSRELLQYDEIITYSSTWMDTVRNGSFGLTNTNRLVRFYKGATGLKTGSTAKAGFCITATAVRDGMTLICVIMGAESRDIRNAAAVSLLDWGFSNFELYVHKGETISAIRVAAGEQRDMKASYMDFCSVLPKQQGKQVTVSVQCPTLVFAPVQKGDTLGTVTYLLNGESIGQQNITADQDVERLSFWDLMKELLKMMTFGE